MKKTLFFSLVVSGLLFAENNNISGIKVDGKNSNVEIIQGSQNKVIKGNNVTVIEGNNNNISNQEIEINKKIDNELMNLNSLNLVQSDKNIITEVLGESKKINKEPIPLEEKNRQCKFNAELNFKTGRYLNISLALSYCDKIF